MELEEVEMAPDYSWMWLVSRRCSAVHDIEGNHHRENR
jgi:hypothetical protein